MLGGLDDQLGAGTWASREMSDALVQPLQAEEKARCTAILQRHMLWQYTDEAPYGPADKQKILGCLNTIQVKLESSEVQKTNSARQSLEMVRSLQRNIERNFTEDDFTKKDQVLKWMNDRDHSMYMNCTGCRIGCLRIVRSLCGQLPYTRQRTLEASRVLRKGFH